MYKIATKISIIILTAVFITACNAVKKVPDRNYLLTANTIEVDGKSNNEEALAEQLVQIPNAALLGFKLRLHMFNLAKENTDSLYKTKFIANPQKYYRMSKWLSKKQVDRLGNSFWYSGWHSFLKRTGEPPAIIDSLKTKRTLKRLRAHYFNQGYFDAKTTFKANYSENKRGKINYFITKGTPTFLDSITTNIESPVLDSMYLKIKKKSQIIEGKQYNVTDFEQERTRLTNYFRNHGIYYFQQQNINFMIDTTSKKAPVTINISNREIRKEEITTKEPFEIYKIGKVEIFTNEKQAKNGVQVADSAVYKNFNLYSTRKLRYRPKAIIDAIFIHKDSLFSDEKRTQTLRALSNLKVFNYPTVQFIPDTITKTLRTKIILSSKDRFSFKANGDVTHSNIQEFGISGSATVSARNIFRGAEILELGLRGNIGSSTQTANPDNTFFNVTEYGLDMRLNFPRLFLPFRTGKIVPKIMYPTTLISAGFFKQENIGLDKENFTSTVSYNWTPNKNSFVKLDLVNIQYVKNVNIDNYFNVYSSSYDRLNSLAKVYNTDSDLVDISGDLKIPEGTNVFIDNSLSGNYASLLSGTTDHNQIKSIKERRDRLTENNLIFATNFTFSKDSKTDLFDKEFYQFRTKLESAGNLLSLVTNNPDPQKVEPKRVFGLQFSQYVKADFEYIKHWDLLRNNIIAIRSVFGIAIPFGNSKSIPFSRSYYAGGSNDNRAWQSYSLGPGSSGGLNDFNEANMKIALNAEYRFRFFGDFHGALFADCGNIWNIYDNETDETKVFKGIKSLEGIALGTGLGFRYDFKFFVVRLDFGFKTYNPSKELENHWFKEITLNKSVLNVGINYPF